MKLKRLFKSWAGKILLFVLNVLTCLLIFGGIVLMTIYSEQGLYLYEHSESYYQEAHQSALLDRKAGLIVAAALNDSVDFEEEPRLRYTIWDENGDLLPGYSEYIDSRYTYEVKVVVTPQTRRTHGIWYGDSPEMLEKYYGSEGPVVLYTLKAFLADEPTDMDQYRLVERIVHVFVSLRYAVYPLTGILALGEIALFCGLMCVSARRQEDGELHPGPLYKVPFDGLLAGGAAVALGWFWAVDGMSSSTVQIWANDRSGVAFLALWLAVVIPVLLGLCYSAAARIKGKTLLRNTVIFRILVVLGKIAQFFWRVLKAIGRGIRELFLAGGVIWRTILGIALYCFGAWIFFRIFRYSSHVYVSEQILMVLTLLAILLITAVWRARVVKGGRELAAGNVNYVVKTGGMIGSWRLHAENLNALGEGMSRAVEARMKSERLKTELITNVSHDLKTPLTSIVNYATLISEEPCDNPKIAEYAQVLLRQSDRMKRLMEDLVEASRASTGNLDVELAPCDAAVLLQQATGEYEERLQNAGIELVTEMKPESAENPLMIQADSRRMWRVFDNLLSNILKYGQSGTRAYLTLERIGDTAKISFKNTSRERLNISADELVERFVRGDAARSTEGNGLGLSIAQSLTELQGGRMALDIDGDLFKINLFFPLLS